MTYKPRMLWPTRIIANAEPAVDPGNAMTGGPHGVVIGLVVEFDPLEAIDPNSLEALESMPHGELNFQRRMLRCNPGESVRKFRARVLEELAGFLHKMAKDQLYFESLEEVEEVKKELQGDC